MLADTEEIEGTGYEAFHQRDRTTPVLDGFRVGGKTGTAQVTDERNRVVDHITWFTAFGPYESPRYAVVVMVESGGSGGGTCAPVACRVFQAVQRRIQPNPAVNLTLANHW
jgi:penicillin-binding protein 2